MNNDDLIRFNPILAKALAQAEEENVGPLLREMVAVTVKAGVSPDLIYAMIKTGRIVTDRDMKLLSEAHIKEWQDTRHEYDTLAGNKATPIK